MQMQNDVEGYGKRWLVGLTLNVLNVQLTTISISTKIRVVPLN